MSTINIYECPTKPTLAYMIAVMQAAADGKPVQSFYDGDWKSVPYPRWSWEINCYRINPAFRAAHQFKVGDYVIPANDKETNRFVRRIRAIKAWANDKSGLMFDECDVQISSCLFRLATTDEIRDHLLADAARRGFVIGATVKTAPTLSYPGSTYVIRDIKVYPGDESCATYVYAICYINGVESSLNGVEGSLPIHQLTIVSPAPKIKKVPMVASDYPPFFWVRGSGVQNHDWMFVPTMLKSDGTMHLIDAGDIHIRWSAQKVMETLEYSADRKVWHKCQKEVPENS